MTQHQSTLRWGPYIESRKMINLQHHYNNCTTPPHMGVEPSVWSPPHVKRCCTVIVVVLYRNQISLLKQKTNKTHTQKKGGTLTITLLQQYGTKKAIKKIENK
jgi:hypothetical protein